jgi:RNA polymerase sigma factor (sigma-70 family)
MASMGKKGRVVKRRAPVRRAKAPVKDIFAQHHGLLKQLARQTHKRFPTADPEDLMQEGRIGLWRAAQRYKKNKGAKFSTFAHRHVSSHMNEYAAKSHQVRLPIQRLRKELKAGRSAPMTVSGQQANQKGHTIFGLSQHRNLQTDGGIEKAHARARLNKMFRKMPTTHRHILTMKHAEGYSDLQISKRLGITRRRLKTLEREALAHARRGSR